MAYQQAKIQRLQRSREMSAEYPCPAGPCLISAGFGAASSTNCIRIASPSNRYVGGAWQVSRDVR